MRSSRRPAAALAWVAVLITSCTATPDQGGSGVPSPSDVSTGSTTADDNAPGGAGSATGAPPGLVSPGHQAPRPATIDAQLPITWEDTAAFTPAWSGVPRTSDGLFLGFEMPNAAHDTLLFTAVDDAGVVLWHAERPPSCTGFALSRTPDGPVAVLTDLGASEGRLQTTATGYDLASGDVLWGPVDVPGSLQGPGLVFASPAPASAMGTTGPRVALSAATGGVVAHESAGGENVVIGEYGGVVVTGDAEQLRGTNSITGDELWRVPNPFAADASAPAGIQAPAGTALIGAGPRTGALLIGIATGITIASEVRDAAIEPLTGTYLALGEATLDGISRRDDGWQQVIEPGSRITAAGVGLVYVTGGGVGRIFNATTGRPAIGFGPSDQESDPGAYAIPQLISSTGAAVFSVDGRIILATMTPP